MNDIDPSAHAARLKGNTATPVSFSAEVSATPATAPPDGNETLAWLAGNRMPERSQTLNPPAGVNNPHADEVLKEAKPADPIQAAARRASVLADLHQNAPRDPRVQSIFANDSIVAEDSSNGNLLTRQMLAARLDIFDAVLTMLGRPVLGKGARTRTALALKGAFPVLSDDAQVEWALSEVRLEETKAFLGQRAQTDLNALGVQLAATLEKHDIWATARAFSMAAHLSVGQERGSAALADLLEMREFEK